MWKYHTRFSKKTDEETEKFKNICSDLVQKSGKYKFLGQGTYGSVYLRENKNFLDFPIKSKDLVVKEVKGTDYNSSCVHDIEYKSKDGEKNKYPKAIICNTRHNSVVSEYLLAIYASQLSSRSFIDTYALDHCDVPDSKSKSNGYIFMEKIEGDLHSLQKSDKLTEGDVNIIALQILYALFLLHSDKIMHNDPHSGNIFYIKIEDDEELSKLKDGDLIEFDFTCNENSSLPEEQRIFYIPKKNIKYIIKLGDFGLGVKYSEPYIFNDIVFDHAEFIDYFNPTYDILTAFSSYSIDSFLYIQIQCFLKNFNPCYLVEPTNEKERKLFFDYYTKLITDYLGSGECYWSKYTSKKRGAPKYYTTKNAIECYNYLKIIDKDKTYKNINNLRKYLKFYRTLFYFIDDPIDKVKLNRQNLNFDLTKLHLSNQPYQRKINGVHEIIKQTFFQEEMKKLRVFEKNSTKIVKF